MKDIEFITRIQVNGEKRELTKEEASESVSYTHLTLPTKA